MKEFKHFQKEKATYSFHFSLFSFIRESRFGKRKDKSEEGKEKRTKRKAALACGFSFWCRKRVVLKLNGFAEIHFGAAGRLRFFGFQRLQHNALKTVHRTVFACRTDIGTGFRPPCNFLAPKKKGRISVLFLWCRKRGSNPHGIATNGF